MEPDFGDIIERSRHGDIAARAAIVEVIRSDLRRIAHLQLRGKRWMSTLSTTALVNESYLRLASPSASHTATRAHFVNLAARVMRQIVCDYARKRLRFDERHETLERSGDDVSAQDAQAKARSVD